MQLPYAVPNTFASFEQVVQNVKANKPEGLDQLYGVFRMLSGSLRRQLGYQDFEDRLHDVFLLVVEAIRDGKLREPSALVSYIHGVARFSLCSTLGVRQRHQRLSGSLQYWVACRYGKDTPEQQLAEKERTAIMRGLLDTLGVRERDILTRFYLHEQSKEQICSDMDLTDTQFRLAKSRAKQRLGRMGAERLTQQQAA